MKNKILVIGGIILLVISILAIPFYINKKKHFKRVNPAFREYVSGFTSGTISAAATIKVQLTADIVDSSAIGKPVSEELFSFSPSIEGKAYWIDSRTIEFRPKEPMPQGEFYDASFFISKVMTVPDSLKTFEFQFRIMRQDMNVVIENLESYSKTKYDFEKLTGTVYTADVCKEKDLEKVLSAVQNGKNLKISWIHESDQTTHHFQVDSVLRTKQASSVKISWDGSSLDVDNEGEQVVPVPSIDDFIFVESVADQTQEQKIILRFSDPINDKQNLDGLVQLNPNIGFKTVIENNKIVLYPSEDVRGDVSVIINDVIENSLGHKLKLKAVTKVFFDDIKPAVRLIGKGVIIPSSNGLVFPFEAVNLSAVDVKIQKIHESNMIQFLQVSNLDGDNELYRVAQTIVKKTIPLQNNKINKWSKYSLDLAEFIKAEPGAVYRVTISFQKGYSTYRCSDKMFKAEKDLDLKSWNTQDDEDDYNGDGDYWSYDYTDDYYDDNYDWNQRDNPCHPMYYRGNDRSVSRNVFASDIGIVAKRGSDKVVNVYVSNIITTDPMSDVTVELYDFQHQLVGTAKTDMNGMTAVTCRKTPFLLIAKKDDQRGYLKLDAGSSISLSMFDVEGTQLQKGLKGFIYGERGVWRPGDSLHLAFILEDKGHKLPQSHPVVLELINPNGQIVKQIVKANPVKNVYLFETCTEPSAPTGVWIAKVKVGGVEFTKDIKIETIMPNRLKIDLKFAGDKLFQNSQGILDVKWLHGAVARNLKADVSMALTTSKTAFKSFPQYAFDDPASAFESDNQTVFEDRIDDDGKATIEPNISLENGAPGVLNATFSTKVFEQGGGFSIDHFTIPFYPYNSYVGVVVPDQTDYRKILYTGEDHAIKVVNVDCNGKLLKRSKVRLEIYKVEWRWWWDDYDNLSDYMSSYSTLIKQSEEKVINGKGDFKFNFKDEDWGRYLIRVVDLESGHKTGVVVYVDNRNWWSRSHGEKSGVTMLAFSSNKPTYNVGEKAVITIPSSDSGRALISIENGSKVLSSTIIKTTKNQTVYSFPVTSEMAPNVYISVTYIQRHAQTQNDLPIRMFGVIPIVVEDPATHLFPIIKTASVYKPEEKASITVREKTGKPMTYTIAVVDEGLLDLTRYKTPNPWNSFYAREALGVKTWDMYDLVMGAYSSKMQRMLSIGGDGEAGTNRSGMKANRFKPMVKYLGPFHLGKGETKTHSFMIPQYIGSVKVMVVAAEEGAYGNAETSVPVRKPLMILGTLPRVLGPGERVKLPVSIFAMEKQIKDVTVQVSTNNMFTINGNSKTSVKFNEIGDKLVSFDVSVKKQIGIGRVKIVATCGKELAEYNVEIDIRNPNPRVTQIYDGIVSSGQRWSTNLTPPGMFGTNKGVIELSAIPPLNLEKRLEYLIQYPHGCIEQTTSSVFPQLYLNTLCDLTQSKKAEIQNNILAALDRLRGFQVSNGGFSYWPGDGEACEWGSTYAGHFLVEASNSGYSLPIGMLDRWKQYQKNQARNWSDNNRYNDDLMQAYRLYTLALAKSPELSAMNRLKESKTLSIVARWQLAAAYQIVGQPEVAKQLVKNQPTTVERYRELWYTYGSSDRDRAIILQTTCLMKIKNKAAPLFMELSKRLSSQDWFSTQETAYMLIAANSFIKMVGTSTSVQCQLQINGAKSQLVTSTKAVTQIDLGMKSANQGKVQIVNTGKGPLYAHVVLSGVPVVLKEPEMSNDLRMSVEYKTMDGISIDPSRLIQGTDFYAEVTIENPGTRGDYKEMALTQIFPSGWEIHNTRLNDEESTVKSSTSKYQDIRDDRVYTYFDIEAEEYVRSYYDYEDEQESYGNTRTYVVLLNASYVGRFYLPTVYCEAMYDHTINASIPGQWVEVVPDDEK